MAPVTVTATFDEDADVWIAGSEDIPGLVTEGTPSRRCGTNSRR
ncbi:MAG: DUF1902 domain-containing protein [Bradyrhizobiaceae bacterium]|nr:DUF1902 domain-containing protein [Bradyrhizobiaceae bacterium]